MTKVAKLLLLVVIVLFYTHPVQAVNETTIRVYIDGSLVSFVEPPIIQNGNTLVQFRPLFEKLGFAIAWEPRTKRIQGIKDGKVVVDMMLDVKTISVNGRSQVLEVAPTLIGDNTMVPLRVVAEASGRAVNWSESDRTIHIVKGYDKFTKETPFSGGSFVVNNGTSAVSGIQPKIYDLTGTTFVSWTKDLVVPNYSGVQFFRSVSKNGSWENLGDQFSFMSKNVGETSLWFYSDGSYFIKDNYGIKQLKPNVNGSYDSVHLSQPIMLRDKAVETIRPVYVDGRASVLHRQSYSVNFGNNTQQFNEYRIVFVDAAGGSSTVVYANDQGNYLYSLPAATSLYYSTENKMLYILDSDQYRQLNTQTGEMILGSDGKELRTPFVDTARPGTSKIVFYNGGMYLFYLDGIGDTYKVSNLNTQLKPGAILITGIRVSDLQNKEVTFSFDSIKLWSVDYTNQSYTIKLESYSR